MGVLTKSIISHFCNTIETYTRVHLDPEMSCFQKRCGVHCWEGEYGLPDYTLIPEAEVV